MTQLRARFVENVVNENEVFLLGAPVGYALAALEIGYADRWEKDRSDAWDFYQASSERLNHKITHSTLHAENQSGMSASKKMLLETGYWAGLMTQIFLLLRLQRLSSLFSSSRRWKISKGYGRGPTRPNHDHPKIPDALMQADRATCGKKSIFRR